VKDIDSGSICWLERQRRGRPAPALEPLAVQVVRIVQGTTVFPFVDIVYLKAPKHRMLEASGEGRHVYRVAIRRLTPMHPLEQLAWATVE